MAYHINPMGQPLESTQTDGRIMSKPNKLQIKEEFAVEKKPYGK